MSDRSDIAVKVLQEFFRERFDWEEDTDNLFSSPAVKALDYESEFKLAKQREEMLVAIYERYCESGRRAKRVKDGGLVYGSPRAYVPDLEAIVSVEEKKNGNVIVVTKRTGCPLNSSCKFELTEHEGQFLIKDTKKQFVPNLEKWSSVLL